ncbi:MAG: NifU N-terminal domain-containing protein [Rickettsiales bacterium]
MFIQTETTPNPLTLKFIPGVAVLESGTAFFTNVEDAEISPLAIELFAIDGVTAIFLGSDFITVTKDEASEWNTIKAPLLTSIMDFFVAKKPVMLSGKKATKVNTEDSDSANDSDIVKQIKELIETRVRPAVAQDGGDIIFHNFSDGIVQLELHGSCSGCPSSTITLKNGIENMLKHYIPEIIAVEAI